MLDYLIENYSRCKLTLQSDKLVAVAGLARLLQAEHGGVYVAGLWKEDIESQLCWKTRGPGRRSSSPYIAPTWSWASINGAIENSYNEKSSEGPLCIQALDVQVKHASHDIFGAISAANLRLLCKYLFRGIILADSGSSATKTVIQFADKKVVAYISFDCLSIDKYHRSEACVLPIEGFCLKTSVAGILLESTSTERGQFRRIGHFEIISLEDSHVFEQASMACQIEDHECAGTLIDADGIKRYVINII
jgi:hypothetical protein